jgi:carboxypeptidase PM20D1
MPPRETAIDILARALVALQRSPMPGGLDGVSADVFDSLARQMTLDKRLLFANRWLFGGLLERELSKAPTTNAMLRTTTAPTILSAGVKENVLPIDAKAVVNFRVHPRDTPESVHEHVKKVIGDERVTTRMLNQSPASRVAAVDSPAYRAMADAVRRVYGDIPVVPGITVTSTDSKRYTEVVEDAYRFQPWMFTSQDIVAIHGTDERTSIENLVRATRFYAELMKDGSR